MITVSALGEVQESTENCFCFDAEFHVSTIGILTPVVYSQHLQAELMQDDTAAD